MKLNKQIKMGAIISYIALIINIMVTLFYTPWMVSKIGKAGYGLYTLAISLIGLLMFDFGLGVAATRFLSKYKAENNVEKESELLGAIFKLYFAIDILILIVLSVIYVLLGNIYQALTVSELEQFKLIFIIVAVFNLLSFPATPLSGIFNAYEQFVPLKLCDLFNKLFSIALVIIFLYFGYGVVELVLCNAFAGITTIILKIILAKTKTGFKIKWKTTDKKIYKEIFSFSVWTTINSVASRLTHNLAPSILAIVCGSIAVSMFAPASSLGSYFYSIAVAINGLFLPQISRFVADNNEDEIMPLMIKVGRYQVFVLGLVLSGFICIGDIFITLWMGKDFISSYYCTILIMIPSFFEYSQQIANTTIVVKNKVKYQSILLILTSIICVGVGFLFSYLWGEVGMCLSIAIIGLVNVLGLNVIHKKCLGLEISRYYKKCYLKMLWPLILATIIARIFSVFVGGYSLFWLLIKGGVFIFIYVTIMWLFALNKDEKEMIIKKFKRRKMHAI